MTIETLTNSYKNSLDYLDMELLIAHSLGKTREFVLTHPEQVLSKIQTAKISKKLLRRIKGEPIAYIIGHKEFYGLNFIVNKNTLIPRPETEILVEEALSLITNHQSSENIGVFDIGTGSGCIAIALAKTATTSGSSKNNYTFYASDISKGALTIAKKNAQLSNINQKIQFRQGNLLEPFEKNFKCSMLHTPCSMLIIANLPYLSKEIYSSSPIDVKKYEPKSALYSPKEGLKHYHDLLLQMHNLINKHSNVSITCLMEISPEQKKKLSQIIKEILPSAKTLFIKDLARKWRICKIILSTN